MKIDYLKINGFGKLKNKEMNFSNNINLIYGQNEAGKTTLLKCISAMFYGLSRNKNGKDITDLEQYKPWQGEDFSGKMKYTLDSGEEIEVFREFAKKNPKIFNSNSENISKDFNIDKSKGNEFFYEQTKIDEEMFFSTGLVQQQHVVLENKEKAMLTQKITNLLTSGKENISYKKAIEKLNKDLIEKIGTDRSQGRPINIVEEKLAKIVERKKDLNFEEGRKDEIQEEKLTTSKKIQAEEQKLKTLKLLKELAVEEKTEEEKIKVKEQIIKDFENQIANIKVKEIKEKKNYLLILMLIIGIILGVGLLFINKWVGLAVVSFSILIFMIYSFIKFRKSKEKNDLQEKEIKILEKNKREKEAEVLEEKNKIKDEFVEQKNKLLRTLNIEERIAIENTVSSNLEELEKTISDIERNINSLKINLNTIEIEEKNIEEDLENKAELEEEFEAIKQEQEELKIEERRIKLAKEALEAAYLKMKNQITPKFTTSLSEIASKISNGKYKNVKFNDEDGLLVELETGEYVNSNRLSTGTIEQLYLALRLSAFKEITEEKVPIILDESFAYYDNERLANTLKYLNEYFKENQIIIFTCSDREKTELDKQNIEYNYIEI